MCAAFAVAVAVAVVAATASVASLLAHSFNAFLFFSSSLSL